MITVTRKPTPQPKAASLKRVLLIIIRPENSGSEYNSSDVTSKIIAVMASQRLTSDNVRVNANF
jgi:hypothetical protein